MVSGCRCVEISAAHHCLKSGFRHFGLMRQAYLQYVAVGETETYGLAMSTRSAAQGKPYPL
jgi:hypothetical protein